MEIIGFPSDFLPRHEKIKPEYGIKQAKAIYSNFIYNNERFSEQRSRFIENRRYAEGLQSVDKYKSLMGLSREVSYLNLDWSVIPVIPVFVDIMVGEFINQDYKIVCEAIDELSLTEKDKEKARLVAKLKLKELTEFIKENTGVDVDPSDNDFIPNSIEEIDLHLQLNHKLDTEIAVEELVEYVYDQNNRKELKRKIIRDLIVLKKGALRCFINENDDIEVRYVDPVNLVTSYSVKDDFSDVKFAGEIVTMPIHKIRRMAKDISEEDLFNIARVNASKHTNPEWNYGLEFKYYTSISDGFGGYDNFLIPVLDFQFISVDVKTFEEKNNNYGGIYFNEKSYGYKTEDKSKKIHDKELEFKYGGFWVIGTENIFNYGVKEDILRKKKNNVYSSETELDYIIFSSNQYEMENKSLVERMIPHADQIQLVSLKIQHLVAKLRPPGQAIDVSALNKVLIGKMVDASPLEIMEIYDHLGVLFYNSVDDEGNMMNRPPIMDVKNDMGQVFRDLMDLYNFNRQQIRDITGINEMRDGISPDNNTPVYVQQSSLKASRNATREITEAYLNMLLRCSEFISIYVSDLIQQNRIDNYKNILGKISVDILKLNKNIELAEIGISLDSIPSEEDQALVEQNIQQSLQAKELRLEDAIAIRRIYKRNTKKADQYLILRRKQYALERMEEAKANSEMNGKLQQQSAQQKAESDAMLEQQKMQLEIQKLQVQFDLEDRNNQREYERKAELIKIQGMIKSQQMQQDSNESFKQSILNSSL